MVVTVVSFTTVPSGCVVVVVLVVDVLVLVVTGEGGTGTTTGAGGGLEEEHPAAKALIEIAKRIPANVRTELMFSTCQGQECSSSTLKPNEFLLDGCLSNLAFAVGRSSRAVLCREAA
jgi:hypothetical protein